MLTGPFCANCGQAARDLHRPLWSLVSEAVGDFFSLDTRLVRTLRPLVFSPGHVAKEYLAGRRAAHVSPLRVYLIAALVFFGLFSVFPAQAPPVYVYTTGSADAEQIRSSARGSQVTIELPRRVWFGDRRFQEASARAHANPEGFAMAAYRHIQGGFILFVPVTALILVLFYRRQGYYVDHLVFTLYFHGFAFLIVALLFLLGRAAWLPELVAQPVRWVLMLWLAAAFPIALRRVYGGSWPVTVLKTIGYAVLYVIGFFIVVVPFILYMAVITF